MFRVFIWFQHTHTPCRYAGWCGEMKSSTFLLFAMKKRKRKEMLERNKTKQKLRSLFCISEYTADAKQKLIQYLAVWWNVIKAFVIVTVQISSYPTWIYIWITPARLEKSLVFIVSTHCTIRAESGHEYTIVSSMLLFDHLKLLQQVMKFDEKLINCLSHNFRSAGYCFTYGYPRGLHQEP